MELYRISEDRYSLSLQASGVANRWNDPGQFVVYLSTSRSLATLELIVHRGRLVRSKHFHVMVISVAAEESLVRQVLLKDLPPNWKQIAGHTSTRNIGAAWYQAQESLLLKVPSAVIDHEYNYLVNTRHPLFQEKLSLVRKEPYFWDERLHKK
jgi:RES domain-containing protein